MARGKKTGGRNFEPGNKFGKGATYHNQDLKAVRRLTKQEIADIGSLIVTSDRAKLKEIVMDPTASVLKIWICNVAIKAIDKGDVGALSVLLDRIVGKVKDELVVDDNREKEITVKIGWQDEVEHPNGEANSTPKKIR